MSKKDVEVKENSEKGKNKKKIILSIIGVMLLCIIMFLLWFFNRKFEVTFDSNNGSDNVIVKVKYNKSINEKDVKTKKELGESFIDWYLVTDTKEGIDVLDTKAFDFKTKIKKNIKLKAIYEGKIETITIQFDSKGGSKVNNITINKGSELTLPSNPTYKGYTFVGWTDKDGKEVKDKTVFESDAILYAKWNKVKENKPTPKPETKPETKPEVKEEKISLSLSNTLLHRNGKKTSKATASTENVSGNVVYSVNSECVSINSSTGDITATGNSDTCKNGVTVVVTATTPKGKTATANLTIEKDLVLTASSGSESKTISSNSWFSAPDVRFEIVPNMDVEWFGKCVNHSTCKYTGSTATLKRAFRGSFEQTLLDTGDVVKDTVLITARTPAGQKIDYKISRVVN